MTENAQIALGVDIGGTHTKLGLVTLDGKLTGLRRFDNKAQTTAAPFLENLMASVSDLLEQAGGQARGIGVSVHGFVDAQGRGPVMCPNTPALMGLDLRGVLEQRFRLPVLISTDLTAHTLGEYAYGSGRGTRRFLCMAIGTGLGAGVIVDGKPLRYLGGGAGDTGHVILEPGGPACAMGCRGCAEALCSVAGIERYAREVMGQDLTASEVVTLARQGSLQAVEVIAQVGAWLGQALATLCSIYLPNRVALSGGIAEAGEALLNPCRQRFAELVGNYHKTANQMFGSQEYSGVEIVLAEMRAHSGVVGAAAEFLLPEGA